MTSLAPTESDLRALGADLRLPDDLVAGFAALAGELAEGLRQLEAAGEPAPAPLPADRDPGRPPPAGQDPLNAITRVCRVEAAGRGSLAGVRIALKDAIAVAGVPLTAGSAVLSMTPLRDSTVADRLLRAGAQIVAMTNMDAFGCSGGGDFSAYGPVLNPHDATRTAGGSSSGAAAVLSHPGITASIGCDQAGSVRLPAAWCGVLGLKPTFGWIPYTRVIGLDPTLDHVGIMARNTDEVARVLAVLAGPDGEDPRTRTAQPDPPAVAAAAADQARIGSLTLGVVSEAFEQVEPEIAGLVREVAASFARLGARVRDLAVPEHNLGGPIAGGLYALATASVLDGAGQACVPPWPQFAEALGAGLAAKGWDLPAPVLLSVLSGRFARQRHRGAHYARAMALRPVLCHGYEQALRRADMLVLPTVPAPAHEVAPGLPDVERVRRGWSNFVNTSQANMTGHPALTIPAAVTRRGLPVGVMLVGRKWRDAHLLAVAAAYQREFGWRP